MSESFVRLSNDASVRAPRSQQAASATELSCLSVHELAGRAKLGCQAAFSELIERLQPRLVSFLHHRLGSLEDAEDVAQDAFARAWEQRERFDSHFQFTTWLYVIAKRRATDHQRRCKPAAATQVNVDLQAIADDSRDQTEPTNIWAIAHRCLSADQYSALWLRYGEQFPVKEVARVLGKSPVGVRVQLHRARKSLERTMRESDALTTSDGTRESTCRGEDPR